MEERHSWLPPGLESPGLEPDDRASQRGARKRGDKKADQAAAKPSQPAQQAPRADREQKPRKLRGDREWKPLDEPDSGRDEPAGSKEPAQPVAAAADSESPDDRRERRQERRDDSGGGDRSNDTDAMGQDKHRQVIGQRYGASRTRQLLYYGLFVAFLIAVYIGGKTAVSHFDKAPAHDADQAPWSHHGAPQQPLGGFEPRTKHPQGPTRFQ